MLDGSDAIADWPLLNAWSTSPPAPPGSPSTTAARRHGPLHPRRPGHRRDGTPLAGEKIRRVLTNDPGMGVIRHVDAGYDIAENVAAERGVRVPMREGDDA